MTGYLPMKMKRKDLDDVYDDFSDFSLSSPARKIRRLDADLPPIMEEVESGIPMNLNSPLQGVELPSDSVAETGLSLPLNEERSLVLYKPVNSPLWQPLSSSAVSITVNQELISGFRNRVLWSGSSDLLKPAEDQLESKDKKTGSNDCLAVVPWVSYEPPAHWGVDVPTMNENVPTLAGLSEPMEAEDLEVETMEIEDSVTARPSVDQAGNGSGETLHQWQQQHCMAPELPPNTAAAPIMWSW